MKKFNFSALVLAIDIEKILLFGNKSITSNDIDLLVVSNDFELMYSSKRVQYVKKYLNSTKKIDLICVTVEEYKKMIKYPTELSKQIIKSGEIVYEK
ncbi:MULTISPECIES: hypothetical protein [Bacillus cereus group]|uniref:hypothetical protein n=1 Tax=Bacillus cereus group TaxID=86661 RepID=UPI0025516989|nr:hypothetical protein [Bacillus paranthracis]MDK7489685.1 hypothetical protein [Bacillus paranthracis]